MCAFKLSASLIQKGLGSLCTRFEFDTPHFSSALLDRYGVDLHLSVFCTAKCLTVAFLIGLALPSLETVVYLVTNPKY